MKNIAHTDFSTFKHHIVFVRLLLPYTLGILLCYNLTHRISVLWLGTICILFFSGLLLINITYNKLKAYRFKGLTGLLFNALVFLAGSLSVVLHNQTLNPDYHHHKKNQPLHRYLKVWVNDEPQLKKGIIRFKAEIIESLSTAAQSQSFHTAASGKLMVSIKTDSLAPIQLNYGEQLIIPDRCTDIAPPYNPAELDYSAWLAAQNIYLQTYLQQDQVILLKSKDNLKTGVAEKAISNLGNPLTAFALELRKKQVAYYRKLLKDDDAFALASTLILGYRADLSQETLDIYSKTGTIHALSVSGMHVGLIYLVLTWSMYWIGNKQPFKAAKILLILSLVWFYALLTGLSPAVLRSAIMLSVFIIAKSFARQTNSANIVAFAAFCLLIYDPFLIWDIGFQLSFLAVIGLIYLHPKIENWWHIRNKYLNRIWSATAMSLAAQLITYPFSIYYFHQFPIYFLLSNLFIMLPVSLLMYLGIIILIGRFDFLGPVFEWLINFTNCGLNWISELPFSNVSGIFISQVQLVMLCLSLLFLVIALSKYKKYLLMASLVCFLIFQSLLAYHKLKATEQKKIIVFNVRKHHATAFISANEAIVFTDLKKSDKTFKYFVKPALDQHRILKTTCINGEKDTTAAHLILQHGILSFYNYQVTVTDLRSYNLKKHTAYEIDMY